MATRKTDKTGNRLDEVVARSQRDRAQREQGYREQALKLYPWVCGRCSREFTRANLHELTVHHRNHDHDYNPPDGSNWELLCLYCHDNEHARLLESETIKAAEADGKGDDVATHKPFAGLEGLLKKKD
jgi:hypothetical protein